MRSAAGKTGSGACSILEVLDGAGWDGGKLFAGECGDLPGVRLGRAGRDGAVGGVVSVTGWGGVGGELGFKSGKVRGRSDGAATDSDETVAVALFAVLVDKTTTVDAGHLAIVESSSFLKGTSVGDAAIFGKAEERISD